MFRRRHFSLYSGGTGLEVRPGDCGHLPQNLQTNWEYWRQDEVEDKSERDKDIQRRKKKEWQSYVNALTINTNASLVLWKIKCIHGKPLSTVNMLKENNNIVYASIEKKYRKDSTVLPRNYIKLELTSALPWHQRGSWAGTIEFWIQ